jgi:ElaB/YqjD/DUF883 family membrane-anchored ribosome-binding protein
MDNTHAATGSTNSAASLDAQSLTDIATQTFAKASAVARDAGETARSAASDTISTVTDQVREILDKQVGSNAQAAVQFAGSMKTAAQDMEQHSPLMAALAKSVAQKVEGVASDLQNQTVNQMMNSAADFTRRQPALVFGLAALAGFMMFRTVKNASPDTITTAAPSIQPGADNSFASDAG